MREVIPGLIWIGNARDGGDISGVMAMEFRAVVDLAMEEAPVHFPREIVYCRFPIVDGAGNSPALLRTAIQTLSTLVETSTPTLVTCGAGMSRSPAIVAAALFMTKGGSPDDWLKKITAAGPHDVAPALWNDIRDAIKRRS